MALYRWARSRLAELRSAGLERDGPLATVTPPPRAPDVSGRRALLLSVNRRRATCLERSLILRAFLDSRGSRHAILIGVRRGAGQEFMAHAWVEGIDDESGEGYAVIRRLEPN